MDQKEFEKYLNDRYEDQIKWYDKKAISSHKAFNLIQWFLIVLAALTPIFIIIDFDFFKWTAVGIAILVSIGTSILKVFKYQENWINYRTTCETLKKEIHFYNARIQGYESVNDPKELFIDRVESLISRENTLWLSSHNKKNNHT